MLDLHASYAFHAIVLFLYTFSITFATNHASLMSNISTDVETYCPYNDKGHPQKPQVGFFTKTVQFPCCDTCLAFQPCGLRKPCCPGVSSRVNNVTLSCKRINYKRNEDRYPSFTYWMVTSCKPEFYGTDLEQQCQNEKMADLLDLASVRPVLDTDTGAIYSNIYCARCNGLSNTIDEGFFIDQLKCSDKGAKILLSRLSSSDHLGILCQIWFQPRDISLVNVSSCLRRKVNTFNTCNMTGQWKKYDSYIEQACHTYQRPYFDGRKVFRNVHCYLCNTNNPPAVLDDMCKVWPEPGEMWGKVSFIAIMEPSVKESVEESKCPPWSVYDPYKDICRNVSCPPLSVQTENGCTPTSYAVPPRSNMRLRLSLLWKEILPNTTTKDMNINLMEDTVKNLTEEMANAAADSFQNLLVAFPVESTHSTCKLSVFADTNDKDGTWILVSFEWTFKFATHHLIPDPALKLASDHSGYGKKIPINVAGEEKEFNVSLTGGFKPFDYTVNYIFIHNRKLKRMLTTVYDSCLGIEEYQIYNIEVAKILSCSVIELQEEEYDRLENRLIFINASKTYLSEIEYIDPRNQPLRVCVADYIPQMVRVLPMVRLHEQIIAMMSFACSMVSVVCLFVTIVTICACPSLHTLPMKLCVCLSVTMIVAQTLQQFAIDQIHLKKECVIFGALIHFFWLKTLFWMNACSFHFFYTFAISSATTRNCITKHAMLVYFIYTFSASALIVVTNACWAGFQTAWKSIGYGGDICYLSSDRVLYMFTIPAAVILFSNVLFLMNTIITLARQKIPGEYSSIHRNYVKIFLKLSTLTGVYWVFGFLKLWTGVVAFEYLFTLFNASQGVFLMVSFVCNKEVLGWYANKSFLSFQQLISCL